MVPPILPLLLFACAADDDGRTAIDGLVLPSDDGALVGTFTADPPLPVVGENALDLTITTADGVAVTDADLGVTTWMPAMGHGAPTEPTVAEAGDGHYRVDALEYSMSGAWEVVVTVTVDGADDTFTLPLDVQ